MSLTSKQLAALQEAGKDKIFQLPERRRHSPGVLAALVRAGLLEATSVGVIWNITAAGRAELARGQTGAGNETIATKLTEAQKRVMGWIGKGWRTAPGPGSAVMVNGKRICNTDTMMALHRAGLVSKDDLGCWSATESGKKLTAELGL